VTLSYDVGQDDLKCWHRYYLKGTQKLYGSRSRFITSWSALYLGVAASVSLCMQTWPAAIVSFGIAIVLCSYTGSWHDGQIERHVQRLSGDPRVKGIFGSRQLILSEAGLREISPVVDSWVKWDSVREPVIEDDHILIPLANGSAAVISRKSYSGPIPFEEVPAVIANFKEKHAKRL
jgi:hypothetical protein